jgi:hypothetical protein
MRCLPQPTASEIGIPVGHGRDAHQGGELGRGVIPGKSRESRLIPTVTGVEGATQMPPDGNGERLNTGQIDLPRRWFDEGAHAPEGTPAADPRGHWDFQSVTRPEPPGESIEARTNRRETSPSTYLEASHEIAILSLPRRDSPLLPGQYRHGVDGLGPGCHADQRRRRANRRSRPSYRAGTTEIQERHFVPFVRRS